MYCGTAAPTMSNRLAELIDAVRNEFDTLAQEMNVFQMHKDDYEHKIGSQVQEMQSIRQAVYELELSHKKIIKQYEDEIQRLRHELDVRNGAPPSADSSIIPMPHSPQIVKTEIKPMLSSFALTTPQALIPNTQLNFPRAPAGAPSIGQIPPSVLPQDNQSSSSFFS